MVKQTAGRDSLGDFAPKFAQLNDDVLFGEVWGREGKLSLKLRSILTVSALVSKGLVDSSFQYHLAAAKKNGVFYYPILVKHEKESWAEFMSEGLSHLLDGTYGGDYQNKKTTAFLNNLGG